MQGRIQITEEWVYPDSKAEELPKKVTLAMPRNGKRGIQILIQSHGMPVDVAVRGPVKYELYQMVKIPVEYNTDSEMAQDGHFVVMDDCREKPADSTRKAPFYVYDCLKPVVDRIVPEDSELAAGYLTVTPDGQKEGRISAEIVINVVRPEGGTFHCRGDGHHVLTVELEVYPVEIPKEHFRVTNWFSLENMATYHHLEYGSVEHLEMIRKYARAMRRVRQTHFFVNADARCLTDRKTWSFDFSHLTDIISIFFEEGFKMMEFGYMATREPDYTSEKFNFPLDTSLQIDTAKGYEAEVKYLKAIAAFLREHEWEDRTIFHISDEPDVHTEEEEKIETRRKVYYMITSLLKRYIPNAKVMEAVKSTKFKGGIDIWVPLTANYESSRAEFDEQISLGEEVWAYVCCVPGGRYLNRFLDMDLIRNRILFWGFSKYNFSGYLHWGFNYYAKGMNPFQESSCFNPTGLGTNFPCGDSHIVYPGDDGPWIGMRLEAQRRGAEDNELLNLLKEKDPKGYEELVGSVFTSNHEFNADPRHFEEIYVMILKKLAGNSRI